MPKVKANSITMNYDQQGTGEPLILIPYLSADHACYAFQVAEYAKHFTCISLDLRGTGETDNPAGAYSTELLADDVVAFMRALGIAKAHVSGLSLGAAIGMWLASKNPNTVKSLSLHSGWPKKYATKPDYIQSLAAFVRSRPAQSVESFMQQSNAVIAHDAESQLSRITAPTLITFGRYDRATSTRFADRMKGRICNSELMIFEGCAHAPIYEKVEEFNDRTLQFLNTTQGDAISV
jgi:pimeloyl-ACP methyl ester carboxylesterase